MQNMHTLEGATAALSTALSSNRPTSLIDVGCGTGTWLRAATELGVIDLIGIEGIHAVENHLHVHRRRLEQHYLPVPFDLGRLFDVLLCLEVPEHIPESSAATLVSSVVSHSDTVLFSAA